MKKGFLLAAIGLVALASCSNEEEVQLNESGMISFRPILERAGTKATETTVSNMKSFYVTAIGNNAEYFKNMEVKGSDANWTTSESKYWPGYNLDFYAYSPTSISGSVNVSTSGNGESKITNFAPELTAKDQKDLVVAVYKNGSKSSNAEGVPLSFKHALTQVVVQAKNGDNKKKVTVAGVKLMYANATGTLKFPSETNGSVSRSESWENLTKSTGPDKSYYSKVSSGVTLTNSYVQVASTMGSFMILPSEIEAWNQSSDASNTSKGSYIALLVKITDDNNTRLYPNVNHTGYEYGYVAVPVAFNWEAGKKYTYNLDFTTGNGFVDPEPTDPGGTPVADPEPAPEGGGSGEEAIGSPIKFTVTVDAWTSETTTTPAMK